MSAICFMACVNCLLKVKLFGGKEKRNSCVINHRCPLSDFFLNFGSLASSSNRERTQKEAGESVETVAFWDASMKCMSWNECQ